MMPSILDIPDVRQRVSRLSVSEYHRLGEFNERGRRTELVRGIILDKMSKSPLHSSLVKWLYDSLARLLPSGYVLRREDPLTLADSEPEPDIAVVRGVPRDFLISHPTTAELLIEVAVSNPSLDRENALLYAEAGVQEYWLVVCVEQWHVEVYRDPHQGRYANMRVLYPGDTLECARLGTLRLPVSDLFDIRTSADNQS